jgi:hypothetical protein
MRNLGNLVHDVVSPCPRPLKVGTGKGIKGLEFAGLFVVIQGAIDRPRHVLQLFIAHHSGLFKEERKRLHRVVRAHAERVRIFCQNIPFRACLTAAYQGAA